MKDIHNREFDNLIGKKFNSLEMRYPNNENKMDNPVIHKFYQDDTWLPHDVPIFETGIGCKFNCTFCNYDFRNIKNPKISAVDNLVEFFNHANSFGITNFDTAPLYGFGKTEKRLSQILENNVCNINTKTGLYVPKLIFNNN